MRIRSYLPLMVMLICAVVVTAQEPQPTPGLNLMPVPASVTFNKDRLAVDSNFKVATRGHSDARLQAGIARFVRRLEGRTVLTLAPGLAVDDQMTQLIINCQGPGQNIPSVQRMKVIVSTSRVDKHCSARRLLLAHFVDSKLCCNYSTPTGVDTFSRAFRSTITLGFRGVA